MLSIPVVGKDSGATPFMRSSGYYDFPHHMPSVLNCWEDCLLCYKAYPLWTLTPPVSGNGLRRKRTEVLYPSFWHPDRTSSYLAADCLRLDVRPGHCVRRLHSAIHLLKFDAAPTLWILLIQLQWRKFELAPDP